VLHAVLAFVKSENIITEIWECVCDCNKMRKAAERDIWMLSGQYNKAVHEGG
jgi:hypothetical protein